MSASIELGPASLSVRDARRFVTGQLESWGMVGLVETAALLTSELVTNSVLHARTPIVVSITRGAGIAEIVVRDSSRHLPRRRQHALEATTGRGLELLERLADSWHVSVDDRGKSIRFTLAVGADPWAAYADGSWIDADR